MIVRMSRPVSSISGWPFMASALPAPVKHHERPGTHIGEAARPVAANRPKRAETHDSGLPVSASSNVAKAVLAADHGTGLWRVNVAASTPTIPELASVIRPWKRIGGHGNVEEGAERAPAVLHLIDQKSLRRGRGFDRIDVCDERLRRQTRARRVKALREAGLVDDGNSHFEPRLHFLGSALPFGDELVNGLGKTLRSTFRAAMAQNEFGGRISDCQFPKKRSGWPVDGAFVAFVDCAPSISEALFTAAAQSGTCTGILCSTSPMWWHGPNPKRLKAILSE